MLRVAGPVVLLCGAVSWGAYASQGNGFDINWGAIAATLIVAGATGAATWFFGRRKQAADATKAEAEADLAGAEARQTSTETIKDLFALVRTMQADMAASTRRTRAAEAREAAANERSATFQRKIEQLEERVARLTEAVAIATVATRIKNPQSFSDLFDSAPCGVVFTSPRDGGRFEWVNAYFCNALGRTKEQIVGLGWQALIHPTDLERTKLAEAAAHTGPVQRLRNRYRHADGSWVEFEWNSSVYDDGCAVAFAHLVRTAVPVAVVPSAPRLPVRGNERRPRK